MAKVDNTHFNDVEIEKFSTGKFTIMHKLHPRHQRIFIQFKSCSCSWVCIFHSNRQMNTKNKDASIDYEKKTQKFMHRIEFQSLSTLDSSHARLTREELSRDSQDT